MKRTYRQIVWSGSRHPVEELGCWELRASFRIGDGDRGYDNVVTLRISDYDWERGGPSYVNFMIECNLIPAVKDAAYRSLCDDRLMLSLSSWRDIAQNAEQRANAAEAKAAEVQEKLDTIKRLLGIVEAQ